MTGSDGADGERSERRSDRATGFSDIASEFADEFGVRSEASSDSRHESGSPDTGDDASSRTSEPDTDADCWEWIGDDESGDATGRNPSEPRASDPLERPNGGGRLWNDGPADDKLTDDGPADDKLTDDGPTDDEPTNHRPTDDTPTDGDPPWDDTDQIRTDTAEVGPEPSLDDQAGETSGRIWNESSATRGHSTTTETARSPSDGTVSSKPSPTGATGDLDASPLDGRRLGPGTNVLIQSESRSEQTRDGCHELLFGHEGDLDPYVLLVRYQPMDGERLKDIATEGHRTHVIAVGYAQSVPPAAEGAVEVTQVNNPNDITRLGIVVSRATQEWSTDDREIRVCYDSLNVLLNYRDVKNAFRFLHVFLSTFTKTDAVAHFHADPLEGDPQAINTLKPLFDEVVSMDSTGTYVE